MAVLKQWFYRSLAVIVALAGIVFVQKSQPVEASITVSGSTYTVTSGSDLFNLLGNTDNYWSSSNVPPSTMTIKVANSITLPATNPILYSGLNNATIAIDFQKYQFYAASPTDSRIIISNTSKAQFTLSNVNNVSSSTSNLVSNVPNVNGSGTMTAYYNTYYGMLLSADYGASRQQQIAVPLLRITMLIIICQTMSIITSQLLLIMYPLISPVQIQSSLVTLGNN